MALTRQYLHPDALYDQLYQSASIDLDSFSPLVEDVTIEHRRPACADVTLGRRLVRVEAVADGIMRLRHGLDGRRPVKPSTTEQLGLLHTGDHPTTALTCRRNGDRCSFSAGGLTLELDARTGDWTLTRADHTVLWETLDGGFRFSEQPPEYAGQRYVCTSILESDEHFLGFGGRIAPLDRRGQSVDIFSVKVGKRSGDYGGFPLPYFISTNGWGLFLNNPWPHVYFDMGRTSPDRWWLHAPGGDCDLFLIDGPAVGDVVRRFTSLTGRIPDVPRWTLGFWCSSLTFNSGSSCVADAERLRHEGYPADVFVLDGPWRGGREFGAAYHSGQQYPSNDLEWHPDFGDGPGTVNKLDELGFKTILHVNSRSFRDSTANAGVADGLLRRHGDEVVPRVGQDDGERYYRDLVEPRVKDGIAGWWTDHSDRVGGDLAAGLPSRNLFGPLWNRLLADVMADAGRPGLSLSRGGGIGSQRYALPWPGDTRCGLDAMGDDIWFMLNAGLSGFPLTSVDLGGFCLPGDPDEDYESDQARHAEMFDEENLSRRVCQFLLFTPVPRIHNNLETVAKLPWNCPETIRPLFRSALEERYRLTPYLYSYVLHAARTGEPLLRPLIYHHLDDPAALEWSTQLYVGEHLLFAPVTRPGVDRWDVYLPDGGWTHMWSGRRFDGGRVVTVDAPLYSVTGLPMFVRHGAVIVRQAPVPSLGTDVPAALEIDYYPAERSSTFDLQESATATSRIEASTTGETAEIMLENNTHLYRTYQVTVHVPDEPGRTVGAAFELPPTSRRRAVLDLEPSR